MIKSLVLKNFRSYKDSKFEFSPKTNIILGKNSMGKTNIIEAVLFACTGKSYRAKDTELIKHGEKNLQIKAVFSDDDRKIYVDEDKTKKFTIKDKTVSRMSFNLKIPVVVFEPDFTQIISRSPETRRNYLDQIILSTKAEYQTIYSKYKRVIEQRNRLLKNENFSKEEMFVWNLKLSELGGKIYQYRSALLVEINSHISKIYSDLASKKHDVELQYQTEINTKDYTNNLLKELEKNIKKDIYQGFTSVGPHRDDIDFFINKKNNKVSASRGENRTVLLSLKIIETKLIEKARDKKPILLLDDVFSELDETRQGKLIEFFYNNQVIITTTTLTPLMHGVSGKIIEI